MDLKLFILRAANEIKLAQIIFLMSSLPVIQTKTFRIKKPETYYSAVISHSYYAIFYTAKAYLLRKKIKLGPPEEHKKTYESLNAFVSSGELDVELLKIYRKSIIKADVLLGIFKSEKTKRGKFTYRKLPQANILPAKESLDNAKFFF